MSDSNSRITIDLEINNDKALQPIEEVEQKINNVKAEADKKLAMKSSFLPGFDEDMNQQLRLLQSNLDRILQTRRQIEQSISSYDKEDLTDKYREQIKAAQRSINDLFDSKNIAKTFAANLTKEFKNSDVKETFKKEFTDGLRSVAPDLKSGIRKMAANLVKANWDPQDDKRIVSMYMQTPEYKSLMSPLQSKNSSLFADKYVERYLRASIMSAVPQYQRSKLAQNVGIKAKAESIREMLPASFMNVAIRPQDITRESIAKSSKQEQLTTNERNSLFEMIKKYRYAADNAVRAGIIMKDNGRMYYNPFTTRAMVDSMASFTVQDFESGARGETKYGVTDVEDPRAWKSVRSKSNKRIEQTMKTMQAMDTAFPWLQPTYFNDNKPYQGYVGRNGVTSNGIYIGRIQHSPKAESRAFAEYTLDMMENGWQINGKNPIVNGKILYVDDSGKKVTAPGKYVYGDEDIVIRPEDWHTITKRRSMEQDILERTKAGSKPRHNDFSDNAIYLKIDERLSDPRLTDDEREAYAKRYATLFKNGYILNGEKYVNTRFNNTHAEFVKESIVKELGNGSLEEGLKLFLVEGSDQSFARRALAAKAMYNQNTLDTEGENLISFMGLNPNKKFKVVVGDFSNEATGFPGFDGVNLINDLLTTQSFQGRTYGDKATFSKFNMLGLRKLYSNLVEKNENAENIIAKTKAVMQSKGLEYTPEIESNILAKYGGDLVIPGAGINGGNLIVPKDTDIIEMVQNIKGFKTGDIYKDMTQEQINAHRSDLTNKYGIYAKTTYDDAVTNSKWMSRQLVTSMGAAFRDQEINKYFQDILFDEVAKLDNEQYVRSILFKGDQSIDLNSEDAQARINNYRNMLFERYGKGDRLLPEGVSNMSMAAPYVPNVINQMMLQAGKKLTAEQLAAQIDANSVISLNTLDEMLGIIRYPSTIGGNISAKNLANDPKYADKIRNLSKQLGMDPEGLYFAPGSKIMEAMQTEDFDGDLNKLFRMNASVDSRWNNISQRIFDLSRAEHEQIVSLSGRSDQTQADLKAQRTISAAEAEEAKGRTYNLLNPEDRALILVEAQKAAAKMGVANSIGINAWQYGLNPQTARALRDSEDHYDVVSVWAKAAEDYAMSDAEKKMLYGGAAFGQIFNWASKAISTSGEGENQEKFWDTAAQIAFNERNIDTVNLPSFNSGSTMASLMSRFIAKHRGRDINGIDTSGNPIYDWNKIFGALPEIENPNSATGRMTQRLREVKADILNGEYIAIGESLEDELTTLAMASRAELSKKYSKDEADRIFRQAGGNVIGNMGRLGITARSIKDNTQATEQLLQLQTLFPLANIYGQGKEIPKFTEAKIEEEKKQAEVLEKKIEASEKEYKQQAERIEKKNNDTIDISKEIEEAEKNWEQQQQYRIHDYNETKEQSDEIHAKYIAGLLRDKGIDVSNKDVEKLINTKTQSNSFKQQLEESTNNIQLGENYMLGLQKYIEAQQQFTQLMNGVDEFTGGLKSHIRKNEARLEGKTYAELYYNKNNAIAGMYARQLEDFTKTESFSHLPKDRQDLINDLLGIGEGRYDSLRTLVNKDFADTGLYQSKRLIDELTKANDKSAGTFDPQIESLNAFEEKLKESIVYKEKLIEMSNDDKNSDKDRATYRESAEGISQNIEEAQKSLLSLRSSMVEERIKNITNKIHPGNRFDDISNSYKQYIDSTRKMLVPEMEGYEDYMRKLDELEKKTSSSSLRMQSAWNSFSNVVQRALRQFGRRLFQQAIQETKKFVKEFDASMTTIQMITLKSDKEISEIGKNIIQTAIDLKTSVSEVASATAALYRQGLSDEEVDERREDVIKFASVTGMKAEEATKIITTALQTGLVQTSEEAMDALTALGDSAATTASEIAKGMQKSAAAAKEAGVSYAQLVTLLTIGTSKTQLGGASFGSALQTLMYRLYKVSASEDFYDENGNHIASTAATKALSKMGISLFGENGNYKGAYDILMEIANGWESADDVTRSMILSTLGAGRQRTNIATLIQGLSEDNGELATKYLNLAENSEGITDTKYEEKLKSLQAAIDTFRSSFDQLIKSINGAPLATGFLDFLSSMLQGLSKANEGLGGMLVLFPVITAAVVGMIAAINSAIHVSPYLKWLLLIIGGGITIASLLGGIAAQAEENSEKNSQEYLKTQYNEQETKAYKKSASVYKSTIGEYDKIIEETRELGEEYEQLKVNMDNARSQLFEDHLKNLLNVFPELQSEIATTSDLLSQWKIIVDGADNSIENMRASSQDYLKIQSQKQYKIIEDELVENLDELPDKIDDSLFNDGNILNKTISIRNEYDDLFNKIDQSNDNDKHSIFKWLTGRDYYVYDGEEELSDNHIAELRANAALANNYDELKNVSYDDYYAETGFNLIAYYKDRLTELEDKRNMLSSEMLSLETKFDGVQDYNFDDYLNSKMKDFNDAIEKGETVESAYNNYFPKQWLDYENTFSDKTIQNLYKHFHADYSHFKDEMYKVLSKMYGLNEDSFKTLTDEYDIDEYALDGIIQNLFLYASYEEDMHGYSGTYLSKKSELSKLYSILDLLQYNKVFSEYNATDTEIKSLSDSLDVLKIPVDKLNKENERINEENKHKAEISLAASETLGKLQPVIDAKESGSMIIGLGDADVLAHTIYTQNTQEYGQSNVKLTDPHTILSLVIPDYIGSFQEIEDENIASINALLKQMFKDEYEKGNYNSYFDNTSEFLKDYDSGFADFLYKKDIITVDEAGTYRSLSLNEKQDILYGMAQKVSEQLLSYETYLGYIQSYNKEIDNQANALYEQAIGKFYDNDERVVVSEQLSNPVIKSMILANITGKAVKQGMIYSDYVNKDTMERLIDEEIDNFLSTENKSDYYHNEYSEQMLPIQFEYEGESIYAFDENEIIKKSQEDSKYAGLYKQYLASIGKNFFSAINSALDTYEESNQAKSSANSLYRSLVQLNAIASGNATLRTIQDQYELNELPNLITFLNQNPNIINSNKSLFKIEDGKVVGFVDEYLDSKEAFETLLDSVASATDMYSGDAERELYEKAVRARIGLKNQNLYSGYNVWTNDLNAIIGSSLTAKAQNTTGKELTGLETKYAETLILNALFGVSGLTNMQQLDFAKTILSDIKSGNFEFKQDSNMIKTISSGISGLSDYIAMSEIINDAGLEQVTASYDELSSVLESAGYSVNQFYYAQGQVNKSIASQSIILMREYGDRTEAVANIISNLAGSVSEVNSQMKSMNQVFNESKNNQYYRELWRSGIRNADTKNAIASMLGIDVKYLNTKSDSWINSRLNELDKEDMENMQTQLDALSESFGDLVNLPISIVEPATSNAKSIRTAFDGFLTPYQEEILDQVTSFDVPVVANIDVVEGVVKIHFDVNKETEKAAKTISDYISDGVRNYEENNADALNIDELYKTILADTEVTDFRSLWSKYGNDQRMLNAVVANDEFANFINSLSKDKNGNYIGGLYEYIAFMQKLASMSNLYTDQANLGLMQNAILAETFINNPNLIHSDNKEYYSNALGSIIGNTLEREYELNTLSPMETNYAGQLIENAKLGIQGLTELQRLAGAQEILNNIKSGEFKFGEEDMDMVNAYTSGLEDFNEYYNLASGGIENLGDSASRYYELQDQLDKQILTQSISAIRAYGDSTEYVVSIISSMSGSIKDANEQMKSFNQTLSSSASNQYYRDLWNAGIRNSDTKNAIASMLGIPVEDLDKHSASWINSMLNSSQNAELYDIQAYADSIAYAINNYGSDPKKYKNAFLMLRYLSDNEQYYIDKIFNDDGTIRLKVKPKANNISFNDIFNRGLQSYNMSNNDRILADKAYESILNDENINDLQSLIDSGYLDQVISNPEFAAMFGKYYNGGDLINSQEGYIKIMSYLASMTGKFTSDSELTRMQQALLARSAISNDSLNNETPEFEDLKAIIGNDLANKYANKNGNNAVTDFERTYTELLIDNALNGIDGLTEEQRIELLSNMINQINNGVFDFTADQGMVSTLSSGLTDFSSYYNMAGILSSEGYSVNQFMSLDQTSSEYERLSETLTKAGYSAKQFFEYQKQLDRELSSSAITATNKYGNRTNEVVSILNNLKTSEKSATEQMKSFNQTLNSTMNSQYYRNQWRSGNRSQDTKEAIANMIGIDAENIDKMSEELINSMLDSLENVDKSDIQTIADSMSELMTATLQDTVGNEPLVIKGQRVTVESGGVELSMAEAQQELANILTEEQQAFLAMLEAWGIDAAVQVTEDEMGKIQAKIVINSLGSGYKGGSSGGGGGGKSAAEKLIEAQKNRATLRNHIIKMIQYQQEWYKDDDQLGNYGRMIEVENAYREQLKPTLEDNLEELKNQLSQTAKNSEDWYTLRDAILDAEEAIEENNKSIADNTRKLKENQQAILKLHTDLEDLVDDEIRKRIQEQRDMVAGTASMEETIFGLIQESYRKQWELIKKDIDIKKQALQEELSLIDKRLQARKDAENQAAKYEELRELQKQLALISMDTTRTKDAAQLRKRIADLQSELAWSVAEDNLEDEKEAIQEQIDAYDQFETDGDEALENFLKDANNFTKEITTLLESSYEELIQWLKDNSDEYKYSLEGTQENIINSWTDTWKQMKGIVDTFWEEIADILSSEESFIDYMKQSSTYLNASADEQKQLEYTWREMYQKFIKAQDTSAEYEHHDVELESDGYVNSDSGNGGNDLVPILTPIKQDESGFAKLNSLKLDTSKNTTGILGEIPSSNHNTLNEVERNISAKNTSTTTLLVPINSRDLNKQIVKSLIGFDTGGVVSNTGLAVVHDKERILTEQQNQMFESLLNMFQFVRIPSFIDYITDDNDKFNNSIESLTIEINGAKFENDADYQEIARRVGQELTRELAEQGFATANYAF